MILSSHFAREVVRPGLVDGVVGKFSEEGELVEFEPSVACYLPSDRLVGSLRPRFDHSFFPAALNHKEGAR